MKMKKTPKQFKIYRALEILSWPVCWCSDVPVPQSKSIHDGPLAGIVLMSACHAVNIWAENLMTKFEFQQVLPGFSCTLHQQNNSLQQTVIPGDWAEFPGPAILRILSTPE